MNPCELQKWIPTGRDEKGIFWVYERIIEVEKKWFIQMENIVNDKSKLDYELLTMVSK